MNHHPIIAELLARERIGDLRRETETHRRSREAQIARRNRRAGKARTRRPIRRRKASPA